LVCIFYRYAKEVRVGVPIMSGTALLVSVSLAVLFGGVAVLAITQIGQIRRIARSLREFE
jgi:hypothetical protein